MFHYSAISANIQAFWIFVDKCRQIRNVVVQFDGWGKSRRLTRSLFQIVSWSGFIANKTQFQAQHSETKRKES